MRLALLLPAAALAGCGASGSPLMPMKVGQSWSYEVRGRELDQVVPFKVARRLSVANAEGYEITSDLGVSRLAWVGTKLVADRLAGTAYNPPLPLLDSRTAPPPATWAGEIVTATGVIHGSATQSQVLDKDPSSGRKRTAEKSTIELKFDHETLVLISWYVDGVGLVRQEEHSKGILLTSLTMTSGP